MNTKSNVKKQYGPLLLGDTRNLINWEVEIHYLVNHIMIFQVIAMVIMYTII